MRGRGDHAESPWGPLRDPTLGAPRKSHAPRSWLSFAVRLRPPSRNIYNTGVTRTEELIAFAAIGLTIIGAAFYLGFTMASERDVDAVRSAMDANMREIRATMDANMREIREAIVNHLDGHPTN